MKEAHVDRKDLQYQPITLRILSCLDLSQLPEFAREHSGGEAAICLKEILDRIPLPPAEAIPGIESVEGADGSESLVRWQVPRTQIIVSKVQDGQRRGEFLFSAETVAQAVDFYRKARSAPYRTEGRTTSPGLFQWWMSSPGDPTVAAVVDRLPDGFRLRAGGMAYWQWLALSPAIPICLTLIWLLFQRGIVLGGLARRRSLFKYWMSLLYIIAAMMIPLGFRYFMFDYLTIRGTAFYILSFCTDVIFLLGMLAVIIGVCNRLAESIIALPHVSPHGLDANLIRIIFRVLGIALAVVVFLEGGRYLGFPTHHVDRQRRDRRSGRRPVRPGSDQGPVRDRDRPARPTVRGRRTDHRQGS